jgi:Tfp pilus assembly protein PilF
MAYLAAKQNEKAKEQLVKATQGTPKYTGVDVARATLAKL